MEKYLVKEFIGDFFAKMHDAYAGEQMEVTLRLDKGDIQIYYRNASVGKSFETLRLIDKEPSVVDIVGSLSREKHE